LALKQLCIQKNIRFACLERGLLPEMLVVDPKGINYGGSLGGERWKQIDETVDQIDTNLVNEYIEQFRNNKVSIVNRDEIIDANEIRRRYQIPAGKRLILIPLQIDYDTNIEQYSPNYKTNEAVIADIVRAIRHRTDALVIVKTHPESKSSDLRQIQEIISGMGVIISDCAIHPLIEASHLVVVRNSTVGLEALLYNKPVVCLAKSAYSEKGFTYDIESSYQLESTLSAILRDDSPKMPQKVQFQCFLDYLLRSYHYHLKDDKQTAYSNRKLLRRVIGIEHEPDVKYTESPQHQESLIINDSYAVFSQETAADRFGRVEFFLQRNQLGDALRMLDLALDTDPLYEPAINKLRKLYKNLNTEFQHQREQRAVEIINQISNDPVKLHKELLKLAQFNEAPRAMILTKSLLQRGSEVIPPPTDISKPDVSVIIPLYNLGLYLPEALGSVRKQTHHNWECIIVNDESTDNSAEIAQTLIEEYNDPRIRMVHQENRGLSGARNTGIRLAKGEFLVTLDPDDSVTPDYFKIGCETMRKQVDLGWVYPVTLQYGAMNRFWSFRAFDPLKLLARNINPCHAMQRKALWEDVGGYNELMLLGYEDWDYWLSALEKGWRAELIPHIMLLYRKRKSSMLKEMEDSIEYEIKMDIIRNHSVGYKPITDELREKLILKRRIPKSLVNESFLEQWKQRNRELKHRLLSQVGQPSLIQQ
ncbi:MAG: glycosyltransferase, partial [Calditrichaeota bacterium]|nr:glycosyltransferase [Calditrichota bacterium]